MPDKTEPTEAAAAPKTAAQAETPTPESRDKLIDCLRALMRRAERYSVRAMALKWLVTLAIALLPLTAPIAAYTLFALDSPEATTGAADETETEARAAPAALLDEVDAGLRAALLRRLAELGDTTDYDSETLDDVLQGIEAARALQDLDAAEAAKGAAAAVDRKIDAQKLFRLRALFAAALTLFTIYVLAALYSQYRLVARHWTYLFPKEDRSIAAQIGPESARGGISPESRMGRRVAVAMAGLTLLALYLPGISDLVAASVPAAALVALVLGLAAIFFVLDIKALSHPRPGLTVAVRAPRAILILTLAASLLVSYVVAVFFIDLPENLEDSILAQDWTLFPLPLALISALVLTTIGMTAFGTMMYARNFPRVEAVEAFFEHPNVKLDPATAGRNIDTHWTAMREHLLAAYKHLTPADRRFEPAAMAAFRGEADRDAPRPAGAERPWPMLRVNANMRPADAARVIRTLTLPLSILLVVSLVVLSLGLDVLEGVAGIEGPLAEGVNASNEAILFLLGAGYTLALGVIYVLPLVRIAPFLTAQSVLEARKGGPAREQWTGSLLQRREAPWGYGFTVEKRPKDDIDAELGRAGKTEAELAAETAEAAKTRDLENFADRVLREHIGARKEKLAAILEGSSYGGAFGAIMGEGLKTQTIQVFTLLSPAVAGTFLSFLG